MPGEPLNIKIALSNEEHPAPPPMRNRRRDRLADIQRDDEWQGLFSSFTVPRQTESQSQAGDALLGLMQERRSSLFDSSGGGGGRGAGGARGAAEKAFFRGEDVKKGVSAFGGSDKLAGRLGGAATALSLLTDAAEKSRKALNEMAEDYKIYSPALSKAMAERDVKATQFEIGEAHKYGKQLAEQANAETDFTIQYKKLTNAVTMLGAGATTAIEKAATEVLKKINELMGNEDVDVFKEMKEIMDDQLEHMRDLGWKAEVEKANALAAAQIEPIQQWMLTESAARKERARLKKKAADEKRAAAQAKGWQWGMPWDKGRRE